MQSTKKKWLKTIVISDSFDWWFQSLQLVCASLIDDITSNLFSFSSFFFPFRYFLQQKDRLLCTMFSLGVLLHVQSVFMQLTKHSQQKVHLLAFLELLSQDLPQQIRLSRVFLELQTFNVFLRSAVFMCFSYVLSKTKMQHQTHLQAQGWINNQAKQAFSLEAPGCQNDNYYLVMCLITNLQVMHTTLLVLMPYGLCINLVLTSLIFQFILWLHKPFTRQEHQYWTILQNSRYQTTTVGLIAMLGAFIHCLCVL